VRQNIGKMKIVTNLPYPGLCSLESSTFNEQNKASGNLYGVIEFMNIL
jgi:hypothetical protein